MPANLPKPPQTIDDYLSSLPAEPDSTVGPIAAPLPKSYRDAANFAKQNNFTVTSTTGGLHNVGSSHYAGRAVDVRTRDKTPEQIADLASKAEAAGFTTRDERVRPPGQKVWGGPHYHLEAPVQGKAPETIDSFLSKQPEVGDDSSRPINDGSWRLSGVGPVGNGNSNAPRAPLVGGPPLLGTGGGNIAPPRTTVAAPAPQPEAPVNEFSQTAIGGTGQPTIDGFNTTRPRTVTPAFNERDFRQYLVDNQIPRTKANLDKLRPSFVAAQMGDNAAQDQFLQTPAQKSVPTISRQSQVWPNGQQSIGANDLAWHGNISPSTLQQLNPSKRALVLAGVSRQMRADDQWKRQHPNESLPEPSLEQKNAFRAKVGLEAVSTNITPNVSTSQAATGLAPFTPNPRFVLPRGVPSAQSRLAELQKTPEGRMLLATRPVGSEAATQASDDAKLLKWRQQTGQAAPPEGPDLGPSMGKASPDTVSRAAVQQFIQHATPGLQSLNTRYGINTGIPEQIASTVIRDATLGAFDFKVNPNHFQSDEDRQLGQNLGTVASFASSLIPYMAASKVIGLAEKVPAIAASVKALQARGIAGKALVKVIESAATFGGVQAGKEAVSGVKGTNQGGVSGALGRIGEESAFGGLLGGATPSNAGRALAGGIFGAAGAGKAALTGEDAPVRITGNKVLDTGLSNTALGALMHNHAPEETSKTPDEAIQSRTDAIAQTLGPKPFDQMSTEQLQSHINDLAEQVKAGGSIPERKAAITQIIDAHAELGRREQPQRPVRVVKPSVSQPGVLPLESAKLNGQPRASDAVQVAPDSAVVTPEVGGEPSHAPAIAPQGSDLGNVDTQRAMLPSVIAAIHDPQVADHIIQAVPVDVMNQLIGRERTPDSLAHLHDMLTSAASSEPGTPISPAIARFIESVSPLLADSPTLRAAIDVPVPGGSQNVTGESGPASVANSNNIHATDNTGKVSQGETNAPDSPNPLPPAGSPVVADVAPSGALDTFLADKPKGQRAAMNSIVDGATKDGFVGIFVDPNGATSADRAKVDAYKDLLAQKGYTVTGEQANPRSHTVQVMFEKSQSPEAPPVAEQSTPPQTIDDYLSAQPDATDRRQDPETRKRIDDMTSEEKSVALRTSDKTGGLNGRAYEESAKKPVQVASDIDGLKYLNDQHNHTFGNAIIKAKGDALKEAGIESYHLSGDEFASQFDTPEQARAGMDRANEILQNKEFTFELPDGSLKTVKGVRFSYETGDTYDQADTTIAARKKANYAAGDTVRGERPPGLSESYSEGQQVDKGEVVHHSQLQPRTETGQFDGPPIEGEQNAANTGQNESDNVSQLPRTETRAEVPSNGSQVREGGGAKATGSDSSVNGGQKEPVPESKAEEVTPPTPEGEKERRLPLTLEAAQMEKGNNLTYKPISLSESETAGRGVLDEKGLEGTIEHVLRGSPDHATFPAGFAALNEMRDQETALRASDPEAADKMRAKREQFAGDMAARATELGQTISAIRAIAEFAPDKALYVANKASKKSRGRELSPEEADNLTKAATAYSEGLEQEKSLDSRLRELEKRTQDVIAREDAAGQREAEIAKAKQTRTRRATKDGQVPGRSLSQRVIQEGRIATDDVNHGEWKDTPRLVSDKGQSEESMAQRLAEEGYGVGDWAFPSSEGSASTTGFDIDIDRFRQAVADDHGGRRKSYSQEDLNNVDWQKKYSDYQHKEQESEDADHVATLLENDHTGGLYDRIVTGEANATEIADFKRLAREQGISDEGLYKLVESARPGGLSSNADLSEPARAKSEGSPKPTKSDYKTKLEQQSEQAKATLKVNLGKLNLPKLDRVGEKGAVRVGVPALEGDAELLAQYAAGRLGKVDTLADLKAEMVNEFGDEVGPHMDKIAQRAYQIRQDARTAEIAAKGTEPERKRTILQEIQKEVRDAQKAVKDAENQDVKKVYAEGRKAESDAERAAKAADDADTKRVYAEGRAADKVLSDREDLANADAAKAKKAADVLADRNASRADRQQARDELKAAKDKQAADRDVLKKEARQRLAQVQREAREADKAEKKSYREQIKTQREAARTATLWDTPIRTDAAAARERLSSADPKSPDTMDDLVRVAMEKMLPDKPGGAVRQGVFAPSKFYADMKAEYSDLVTTKNQKEIYKRASQQMQANLVAARETARLRNASAESKRLWDKMGMDVDTQGVLIAKAEVAQRNLENRSKMAQAMEQASRSKLGHIANEIQAGARALQTSLNMHMGRQGLHFLITHPWDVSKPAIAATIKGYAALKPEAYRQRVRELQQHPDYALGVKSGLSVSELPADVGGNLARGVEEDLLQSTWASKLPHVRLSQQGFALGMNTERVQAFSRLAQVLKMSGKTFESHPADYKELASFVNDATGRGDMPKAVKTLGSITNKLFYATRLNVSRVKTMNDLFNPMKYQQYSPEMRKIMAGEALRLVGGLAAIYGTAHLLGMKITGNPDDADFGKVVVGNTHYDVTGGQAGNIRFLYRLGRGVGKLVLGQKMPPSQDPLSVTAKFMRGKLAPIPGAALDLLYGKDTIGKPANLKIQSPTGMMRENIAARMLVPLVVKDFVEAYEEGGMTGVAKTAPVIAGFGVLNYEPTDRKGLLMGGIQRAEGGKKVADELNRLGIDRLDTTKRAKQIGDKAQTALTDAQQKALAADTGKYLNPALEKLVTSDTYAKMSDEAKKTAIDGIIKDIKGQSLERFKGMTFKQRRELSQGAAHQ